VESFSERYNRFGSAEVILHLFYQLYHIILIPGNL
jgi:hypothetical protein